MLPGEIQKAIAGNAQLQSGYQNFLNWIAAGAKHGSYAGLMPNEAVVRVENTPWGENIAYDAAGNAVSQYRPARPGEVSPYGGAQGVSAPAAPTGAPLQAYLATDVAPRLLQGLQQNLQTPAAPLEPQAAVSGMSTANPDDMAEWLRKRARGAFVAV